MTQSNQSIEAIDFWPISDEVADFLTVRDSSPKSVVDQVLSSFGQIDLVVASGSVAVGFGNSKSDLDILVLTESGDIGRMPIMLFGDGVKIDAKHHPISEVVAWCRSLTEETFPPTEPIDRKGLQSRRKQIHIVSRIALGEVLAGSAERRTWHQSLSDAEWLRLTVESWWRTEAVRQRVASAFFRPRNQRLTTARLFDSLLAALEARAAVANEIYFTTKWLPEKLRRAGLQEELKLLQKGLRMISDFRGEELENWLLSALDEIEVPDGRGWTTDLWLAPGSVVRHVDEGTAIARWEGPGAYVPDVLLDVEADGLVWSGPAAEVPPEVAEFFRNNLLWMAVRHG